MRFYGVRLFAGAGVLMSSYFTVMFIAGGLPLAVAMATGAILCAFHFYTTAYFRKWYVLPLIALYGFSSLATYLQLEQFAATGVMGAAANRASAVAVSDEYRLALAAVQSADVDIAGVQKLIELDTINGFRTRATEQRLALPALKIEREVLMIKLSSARSSPAQNGAVHLFDSLGADLRRWVLGGVALVIEVACAFFLVEARLLSAPPLAPAPKKVVSVTSPAPALSVVRPRTELRTLAPTGAAPADDVIKVEECVEMLPAGAPISARKISATTLLSQQRVGKVLAQISAATKEGNKWIKTA